MNNHPELNEIERWLAEWDSAESATLHAAAQALAEAHPISGPFARLAGITYEAYGNGQCTAALLVRPHLLNPLGIAHGGVAFMLADSAAGGAAISVLSGQRVVTQDMQIRYHGPVRPNRRLVAAASVVHHGARTVVVACRITQDDTLVATTTGTFAILGSAENGSPAP